MRNETRHKIVIQRTQKEDSKWQTPEHSLSKLSTQENVNFQSLCNKHGRVSWAGWRAKQDAVQGRLESEARCSAGLAGEQSKKQCWAGWRAKPRCSAGLAGEQSKMQCWAGWRAKQEAVQGWLESKARSSAGLAGEQSKMQCRAGWKSKARSSAGLAGEQSKMQCRAGWRAKQDAVQGRLESEANCKRRTGSTNSSVGTGRWENRNRLSTDWHKLANWETKKRRAKTHHMKEKLHRTGKDERCAQRLNSEGNRCEETNKLRS